MPADRLLFVFPTTIRQMTLFRFTETPFISKVLLFSYRADQMTDSTTALSSFFWLERLESESNIFQTPVPLGSWMWWESASWIYLFKIWDVEIRQGHIYMPSFWFLLSGKAMRNTWGFFASTPGPSLASRDNKSLEPLDEAFRSLGCSSRLPFSQFLDSSEVAKVEATVLPLPVGDFHQ